MDIIALPVFFITFRESLETAIIVSVLIAFIRRTLGGSGDTDGALLRQMEKQVWLGTAAGGVVCVLMGVLLIAGAYGLGAEDWAVAEDVWEGTFALLASVIITAMGAVLLRVSRLQDKWRLKLTRALNSSRADDDGEQDSLNGSGNWIGKGSRIAYLSEKYALFILPFITVLREGFEGVVFVAGVGLGYTAKSIAISTFLGLLTGAAVGYLIYKGSNFAPMQQFLAVSTCFLYLVAAGLFSKGVWHLEANEWNKIVGGDAAELGSGPGSYDITKSVWHVNCCNPDYQGGGGWGIFNAVLGWTNSATVGSVVSYNMYWVAVTAGFLSMTYKEKKGHYPFMKKQSSHGDENEGQLDGDRMPLLRDERA